MRTLRVVPGLLMIAVLAFAPGCNCETTTITCGDNVCDDSEDTSCADCTFEPGESLTYTLTSSDFLTNELSAAFGISEADVLGAFAAAKPANVYDFNVDWGNGDVGTYWVGIYVNHTGTDVTVRAVSPVHDTLMVCESPDGTTLFANDDFDTAMCVMMGLCDPGMILMGQTGAWLCIFAAAPFPGLTNSDPFATMTISVE